MKKVKKGESKKQEQIQIELIPDLNAKLGRIYSNYIQISHSPWDFTLKCCDAPSGADILRLKTDNKVNIPNLVEIVIPVNLISGLIKALTDQSEKYIKEYGGDSNDKSQ